MSTNVSFEFAAAQKRYNQATNVEEKIAALEEMISQAPAHKGGENMRADLRTRLKKILEKKEKSKSIGKSTLKSIKKDGYQVVLVGLPNSGKSSLLAKLTNAKPRINAYPYSTKEPELGSLDYKGVRAQIVDLPSIGSEYFDSGIVNTADTLLMIVEKFEDKEKVEALLTKAHGKKILVINKTDLLSIDELRKMEAKLKSRKILGITISCVSGKNLDALKDMIIKNMSVIRVYTKEPGKEASKIPITLPIGSTVRKVAESILKGFSKKVKETRLTGPSSKFPNQHVGLDHTLKDLDIVEFHTK